VNGEIISKNNDQRRREWRISGISEAAIEKTGSSAKRKKITSKAERKTDNNENGGEAGVKNGGDRNGNNENGEENGEINENPAKYLKNMKAYRSGLIEESVSENDEIKASKDQRIISICHETRNAAAEISAAYRRRRRLCCGDRSRPMKWRNKCGEIGAGINVK